MEKENGKVFSKARKTSIPSGSGSEYLFAILLAITKHKPN